MVKGHKERPRLGRGLSSLIVGSATSDAPAQSREVETAPMASGPNLSTSSTAPFEIPLAAITTNPQQPRRTFNDASLQELATSLRSTGLIQPVIVRKIGDGYQLVAGERRWRAAALAEMTTILAIVREVDDPMQAQMALIENTQREDLNAIDRAKAYHAILEQLDLTQAELASRLGEDRSSIANHLRLLSLSPNVQTLVASKDVSLGHAKILAGIDDVGQQETLATKIALEGLSVRQLERLIGGAPADKAPAKSTASPHLAEVEESISRQLGMRVNLRASKGNKRGKLVIHYGSLDQFDDLIGKLGVKLAE